MADPSIRSGNTSDGTNVFTKPTGLADGDVLYIFYHYFAADLDKPDVSPSKPLRKDCKVCNGKGRYLSGDGLSWIDCTACIPPSTAALEQAVQEAEEFLKRVETPAAVPEPSPPPADEVVFAESTLPELAARMTQRTAVLDWHARQMELLAE